MGSRSVNMVILVGNLTRDPEMRYTPSGSAVTTFGLATNREWTDSQGQKQEAAEFHNIVAWGKLGELCNQLLKKGRKVYVRGRLSTSSWEASDNTRRTKTEVVIDEMVLLDSRRESEAAGLTEEVSQIQKPEAEEDTKTTTKAEKEDDELKDSEEGEKAPF